MSGASPMVKYETEERGSLYSLDYRCYIKGTQGYISSWHDIPLRAEKEDVFNMVVGIPRGTNATMKMATKEPLAPIMQVHNNGQLQFVPNIEPHMGHMWNCGFLPQTWCAKSTSEPIDVLEIGSTVQKRGAILQVKVIGCVVLIDEEIESWKVVAINVSDPRAGQINSLADIRLYFPNLLDHTYEWLRKYKIPTGKPVNQFSDPVCPFKDQTFCNKVIDLAYKEWVTLVGELAPEMNTLAVTVGEMHRTTPEHANEIVEATPAARPESALPANMGEVHNVTVSSSESDDSIE